MGAFFDPVERDVHITETKDDKSNHTRQNRALCNYYKTDRLADY